VGWYKAFGGLQEEEELAASISSYSSHRWGTLGGKDAIVDGGSQEVD